MVRYWREDLKLKRIKDQEEIILLKLNAKNGWLTIMGILLVASFLVITSSYFNTREIDSLSRQCAENGGNTSLEIHSALFASYSFECKR